MTARALMILGTASHVGKSIITAALGRILTAEGYRVAPFKAQNMSLNSAATPDGREIGRAQALQAEACRIAPRAEMNPILLKPSTDSSAQAVVMGRVWGQVSAADYHQRRVEELFPIVLDAYHALAACHDIIVMEGAGSPAEINLKAHDIVNMRMAQAADAACLLVGDIDRGGVFASLLGTVALLDPDERALLRGFIINKFRGDACLLEPGIDMIAARIQLPCAGVVPFLHDIGLDEEDSVALDGRRRSNTNPGTLRAGVIAFPYISNFTDFDPLAAEPSVSIEFIDHPEQLENLHLLILPGSKQTLDDLHWLRHRGFDRAIEKFNGRLMGICGGMQMLGRTIEDPTGAENGGIPRSDRGLGLLPIHTVLQQDKVTRLARGHCGGASFQGYEIHLGETIYADGARRFAEIQREGEHTTREDGAVSADGRVIGTYIHGIFSDDEFRHSFLKTARAACGLPPPENLSFVTAERERRIDRLANHVRTALDMDLIRRCLE